MKFLDGVNSTSFDIKLTNPLSLSNHTTSDLIIPVSHVATSHSACSNRPARPQPVSFLVKKRKSFFPGSDPHRTHGPLCNPCYNMPATCSHTPEGSTLRSQLC